MLTTSAILAYSSLTLVKPLIRPVGLPWASWVWKTSLGLGYSAGPGRGGDGGGSGGAVGSEPSRLGPVVWLWSFGSSSGAPASGAAAAAAATAIATVSSSVWGLLASPFSMGSVLDRGRPRTGAWVVCFSGRGAEKLSPAADREHLVEHLGQLAAAAELVMRVAR